MRALVTGNAGRVGARVVQALLARGAEVVGLDAKPVAAAHPHYRHVRGSLDDEAAVGAAAADIDTVLHLGALMSWRDADSAALHRANVTGTWMLLEAVARRKLARFVFASSGEVYPENKPRFLPIDETHPTEPSSIYGVTKLVGETLVQGYGRRHGMPWTILRFSHTQDAAELLDPDSFFSGPRFFLRPRIRQQEAFGNAGIVAALRPLDDGTEKLLLARGPDGKATRMPICDTRDLVAGILCALDAPAAAGGVFNLHPDEAVAFDDLLPRMAARTGLPLVECTLPVPVADYVTSNARARAELGFRPHCPIPVMLDEAVAAWRRRNEESAR